MRGASQRNRSARPTLTVKGNGTLVIDGNNYAYTHWYKIPEDNTVTTRGILDFVRNAEEEVANFLFHADVSGWKQIVVFFDSAKVNTEEIRTWWTRQLREVKKGGGYGYSGRFPLLAQIWRQQWAKFAAERKPGRALHDVRAVFAPNMDADDSIAMYALFAPGSGQCAVLSQDSDFTRYYDAATRDFIRRHYWAYDFQADRYDKSDTRVKLMLRDSKHFGDRTSSTWEARKGKPIAMTNRLDSLKLSKHVYTERHLDGGVYNFRFSNGCTFPFAAAPGTPALCGDAFPTVMNRSTVDIRLVLFGEVLKSNREMRAVKESWIEYNARFDPLVVETEWRLERGAWAFQKRESDVLKEHGGDAAGKEEREVKDSWEDSWDDDEEAEQGPHWHTYSGDFEGAHDGFSAAVRTGTDDAFWSFVQDHAAGLTREPSEFADREISQLAVEPSRVLFHRVATFMFVATTCLAALEVSDRPRADDLYEGYLERVKQFCGGL